MTRHPLAQCKAALPYLRAAGRSSIVNVASVQASRGFSGYPGYAATKVGEGTAAVAPRPGSVLLFWSGHPCQ